MDADAIKKIAHLARITIDDNIAQETANSISDVLALVDQLASVDTDGVSPMAHPLDVTQRLRTDEVTEANVREQMQAIAPAVADGLYLVPKVID